MPCGLGAAGRKGSLSAGWGGAEGPATLWGLMGVSPPISSPGLGPGGSWGRRPQPRTAAPGAQWVEKFRDPGERAGRLGAPGVPSALLAGRFPRVRGLCPHAAHVLGADASLEGRTRRAPDSPPGSTASPHVAHPPGRGLRGLSPVTLGVYAVCWAGPRPLRTTRPARAGDLVCPSLPPAWPVAAGSFWRQTERLLPGPEPRTRTSIHPLLPPGHCWRPRALWSEPPLARGLAPGAASAPLHPRPPVTACSPPPPATGCLTVGLCPPGGGRSAGAGPMPLGAGPDPSGGGVGRGYKVWPL